MTSSAWIATCSWPPVGHRSATRHPRTTRYCRSRGRTGPQVEHQIGAQAEEGQRPRSTHQRWAMAQVPTGNTRLRSRVYGAPRPGFRASCSVEQVVPQQGNKRHRDQARGDQGTGNHDRQAVDEFPRRSRSAGERAGRRQCWYGRIQNGLGQLGGAEPGRHQGWMAQDQFAFDGVPATTGSSTSSPSAMISEAIETCCRSIPSIKTMPYVMASVSGMEMAIRRSAPFQEAQQGHQDHEADRFVEGAHKQIEVLLHLTRLVRGPCDDQIVRQCGFTAARA